MHASLSLPGRRSVSVSHTQQRYRDTDPVSLVSASYNRALCRAGYLSVSVLRTLDPSPQHSISLSFPDRWAT